MHPNTIIDLINPLMNILLSMIIIYMDNFREYLIFHDALINTNNNVTSKYNIYILLFIIFLLLLVICYLIKKISDISSNQKENKSIIPRQNNVYPQLYHYNYPQLQNYSNPQLQFSSPNSNYYNNKSPIIEEIY